LTDILTIISDWLGWNEAGNRLLVVLIIVTAVVGIMGPLLAYLLQRSKIPKLVIDGSAKSQLFASMMYVMKIKRIGGEGIVNGVEGFIQVENESKRRSIWGFNVGKKESRIDIAKMGSLLLFEIHDNDIMFLEYYSSNWTLSKPKPLEEYLEKKIVVEVEALYGKVQNKPYSKKTIKEIIEQAELTEAIT
jgi:hypothetical protein